LRNRAISNVIFLADDYSLSNNADKMMMPKKLEKEKDLTLFFLHGVFRAFTNTN